MTNNPTHVMEIVTFRLNANADTAAFLEAAKAVDRLLHSRGTAVARSLVMDDDDLWTDIVEWTSMAEAQSAAEELTKEPAFAPFGAMIDPATITMRHATMYHQMG